MRTLRIALAQINTTVGDLAGNARKISERIAEARAARAHVVAFPELAIAGYPPEDLLLNPAFLDACWIRLEQIARSCRGIVAVIGFPEKADDLYNSAAIVCDGEVAHIYRKHFLPNYGVFDEDRYFQAGREISVGSGPGWTFGVSICEDIWYTDGPPAVQALQGNAELLINISASPYHTAKSKFRERMLATRAADSVAAVAFCNAVGGQDELVFDGGSVVLDCRGHVCARARPFVEELMLADICMDDIFRQRLLDPRRRKAKLRCPDTQPAIKQFSVPLGIERELAPLERRERCEPLDWVAEIYQALVLGTRDYVQKNRFEKVVIGLSGGIDSSLVACIAADAIGAESVVGVLLPSRYSSVHSKEDAEQLCGALGIRSLKLPIEQVFSAYLEMLAPVFDGRGADLAEENLQARIRGTTLMALSNKFGWLVLTTGNKSETSTGYATLYGDMAGGFAVIKDVPKTLIYELARFRNSITPLIPERVFLKPPSAELRPDQKDSDSLPEYWELDPILSDYVERNYSVAELVKQGFALDTVRRVVRLVDRAEYKRRQAAPGVKITARAFGKDRRLPITNHFEEGE
jgi:NAD+ synthase (glutamine-hydrolysing)